MLGSVVRPFTLSPFSLSLSLSFPLIPISHVPPYLGRGTYLLIPRGNHACLRARRLQFITQPSSNAIRHEFTTARTWRSAKSPLLCIRGDHDPWINMYREGRQRTV
ncbi:uncharacterized protein B0T23DRAFT_389940 [Neurospora hispaniola]|uniref:Uncharacterized protein n=1 Tax=Neurospora hispaniola TaxID=588809 RepID=A0AAJ0HZ30_9PEZI|nr:hypothetical protein B0T23DRAFT_389940 [Neurospora hispaniola]